VFRELAAGYDQKSGNHITALNYYGARHVTSSAARPITKPEDMKGLKIRVPDAPAYMAFPQGAGRQPDADRLCRGLPGAAKRHGGRAGEPAAHHRSQEVL
jgi:hypothetical protein